MSLSPEFEQVLQTAVSLGVSLEVAREVVGLPPNPAPTPDIPAQSAAFTLREGLPA